MKERVGWVDGERERERVREREGGRERERKWTHSPTILNRFLWSPNLHIIKLIVFLDSPSSCGTERICQVSSAPPGVWRPFWRWEHAQGDPNATGQGKEELRESVWARHRKVSDPPPHKRGRGCSGRYKIYIVLLHQGIIVSDVSCCLIWRNNFHCRIVHFKLELCIVAPFVEVMMTY